MDFEPSSEQQMLIDMVRRFVRTEIIPLEAKLDPDASELAPEDHARLVQKTKAMGLYGIDIPEHPDISDLAAIHRKKRRADPFDIVAGRGHTEERAVQSRTLQVLKFMVE